MILDYLILAGGIGAIVVMYAIIERSTKRNELLEDIITKLDDSNTSYTSWFLEFKNRVVEAHNRLKSIDASGHFEADDEVGYFFKELKVYITRLYDMGILDEIEKKEIDESNKKITTEDVNEVLRKRNKKSNTTDQTK
jgi:hypothetical protein